MLGATFAEDGSALAEAQPLVTHHYLKTLESKKNDPLTDDIKILLVEDNRVNQLVATGILKKIGFTADIANNGIEALNCLKKAPDGAPYTLILMDCQMPEMDGYETSRQIRSGKAGERYLELPIIAMTANGMQDDKEKCLNAGMNDYLTKPVNADKLSNKLEIWIKPDAVARNEEPSEINKTQTNTNTKTDSSKKKVIWDESAALHRMGNDINFLIPLIKLFMTDMSLQLAELDQAYEDNDLDTARRAAHTIKGSAANLSALQLQSLAAELELLIKPLLTVNVISVEDEAVLAQAVFVQKRSELRDANEIVMQCLAQYLSEHEQASQSSEELLTNEQLKNLLEPLMLKIQQGDYIEPQALDKLSTGVYDESLQQMINQLLGQINAFDSNNAIQSINDIMLRIESASSSTDEVLHDIK